MGLGHDGSVARGEQSLSHSSKGQPGYRHAPAPIRPDAIVVIPGCGADRRGGLLGVRRAARPATPTNRPADHPDSDESWRDLLATATSAPGSARGGHRSLQWRIGGVTLELGVGRRSSIWRETRGWRSSNTSAGRHLIDIRCALAGVFVRVRLCGRAGQRPTLRPSSQRQRARGATCPGEGQDRA